MLFICKDGNLIDVRYQNIYNKNKHSLSIVRNQVCDNFNNLVDAFDKTGNFFLSIFETNYLNEIPLFKKLFNKRLEILMNTYKSRIESINKSLETNDNMPNLNRQFFDATSSSSTNLYVKAYEFTPHQHALRVYEQLYQQKNENKKIKNNYELIVYIGNKDINNNNGYNGMHNNCGNNGNDLSSNSIGSGNNGGSSYYNGISNSIDNNANNDNTLDKNKNTGNGALNTKANDILDKDDQNIKPTPATYNKNNASATNYQNYILIGVVGFSFAIVSATIIAIMVKRRYFDKSK
ncbi:hypothetical protein COBT_002808 [Conglomerata obtusa]